MTTPLHETKTAREWMDRLDELVASRPELTSGHRLYADGYAWVHVFVWVRGKTAFAYHGNSIRKATCCAVQWVEEYVNLTAYRHGGTRVTSAERFRMRQVTS